MHRSFSFWICISPDYLLDLSFNQKLSVCQGINLSSMEWVPWTLSLFSHFCHFSYCFPQLYYQAFRGKSYYFSWKYLYIYFSSFPYNILPKIHWCYNYNYHNFSFVFFHIHHQSRKCSTNVPTSQFDSGIYQFR